MAILDESLGYLFNFLLPYSGKAAIEDLESILYQSRFKRLYRYFFPQEYQKSQERNPDVLKNEDSVCIFGESELELLTLINENLFPLDIDEENLEEEEYLEYVEEMIPIRVFGWCDWQNEGGELEHHGESIQTLMFLADENLREDNDIQWDESSTEVRDSVNAQVIATGFNAIDKERLENLCQQEDSPLRYLFETLVHAQGESDNVFLDCPDTEMINRSERDWTIANVKAWAKEWQEAKPILERIETVVTYLTNDLNHLNRVFELWNLSIKN